MPSEPPLPPSPPPPPPIPPFRPPSAAQGLVGDSDEVRPEVDGPPRRTSPRTLILPVGALIVGLVFLVPNMMLQSATTSGSESSGSSVLSSVWFVVIFLIVGPVVSLVSWVARTYTVGSDELVIDEGVFRRRRRVVPYGRVQQVDIDQKFFPQLLRICSLTIETAGSGDKVTLGLLDAPLARGVRRFVLARRAEIQGTLRPQAEAQSGPAVTSQASPVAGWPGEVNVAAMPEAVLLRLSPSRLALAGITHNAVTVSAPALVLLGVGVGVPVAATNPNGSAAIALMLGMGLGLVLAAFVAVLVVVQYVVGRHGFTLAEQGDDLHLRFGMLQVHNLTIPRRRVQHITIIDNPIRRAMGLAGLQLHSAAPAGSHGQGVGDTQFEIPILARADLDVFLHVLMGGDWSVPPLIGRPPAARRRAITRRTAALVLAMALPALAFLPGSLVLLSIAVLGVPWGIVAHRRAGYAEGPEVFALARGVLHHRVDLIPYGRVQSATTGQSPFQRLSDLRTLHINVAGRSGDPRLSDLPGEVAIGFAESLPRRSEPLT